MNSSSLRSLRLRGKNSGFTLLEVLTVIAVILVLIGLFVGGYGKLQTSNKRTLTIARMQILQSMLSELQAAGRNQYNSQWFMSSSVALNAYNYGNVTTDNYSNGTILPETDTLLVNNVLTTIAGGGRQEAINDMTVGNTSYSTWSQTVTIGGHSSTATGTYQLQQGIMTQLAALPNNAKTLAGLPGGATEANAQAAALSVPSAPVVLDGWGNPILFVPAGGLQNVYLNINNGATISSATWITSSNLTTGGLPFWVSAGPDGDFARGDDNIYSFNPQ